MAQLSGNTRWAELDSCLAQLATAADRMRQLCRPVEANGNMLYTSMRDGLIPPDAPLEARRNRETMVATLAKMHILLAEPTELLPQLAMQNQMLAGLHWLGQFQILAFIPNQGSIALKDLAELADVPENQLRQIIRVTAASGFLHETQPDQVEHSAISAPFGNRPSYHDALMFLSETAAPAAMQMAAVTQHQRHQRQLLQGIADHPLPLVTSVPQQDTPRRRRPSYLRHALGDPDSSIASILTSFDWAILGEATVVDIGARSTATACALAEVHPTLKLVVQISEFPNPPTELSSRITIQSRSLTMPQPVRNAAIYALRIPLDFPAPLAQSRSVRLRAELEAHLSVLQENDAARLILTARVHLSESLQSNGNTAKGLVFDMSLLQLVNDRELDVAELSELVRSVGDVNGYLILEGELPTDSLLGDRAFKIRYQQETL